MTWALILHLVLLCLGAAERTRGVWAVKKPQSQEARLHIPITHQEKGWIPGPTELGRSFLIDSSIFYSDCLGLRLQNTHFYLLSKKRVPAAVGSNKSLQVSHRGATSLICTHKAGVMQGCQKATVAGTCRQAENVDSHWLRAAVPYWLPKSLPCMRTVGFSLENARAS